MSEPRVKVFSNGMNNERWEHKNQKDYCTNDIAHNSNKSYTNCKQ